VDFALANLAPGKDSEVTIFPDDSTRGAAASLASRWKRPVARVHALEGGLTELARLVASSDADSVVLSSLSSVSVIEQGVLSDCASRAGDQVVKISLGRTPIEMYVMSRDRCIRLLGAAIQRGQGAAPLRAGLFEGVLHTAIDLIEDLPGELLFQNDLMEYFESNLWVVSNCENERYHRIVSRLPPLAERSAESHIAEKGAIRNSWIGSGVEVEGVVEDSIIFANVIVKRNAVISRSVVLNGNRIGTGSEIHNSLILPFSMEVPRTAPNIGDNCAIGAKNSVMRNADFPGQIRGGVTLIGTNADIPNGFHAEAASYVAPGVSPSVLKRLKVLRKGTSILYSRPDSAEGENGNGRHPR
jgi:carbonic anhydrase/acetyltransferase-like protein (isoleucine patch superfamily)